MFVPGTPKEIVELLADQARSLGSSDVSVWDEVWPPDQHEGFPDPPY